MFYVQKIYRSFKIKHVPIIIKFHAHFLLRSVTIVFIVYIMYVLDYYYSNKAKDNQQKSLYQGWKNGDFNFEK